MSANALNLDQPAALEARVREQNDLLASSSVVTQSVKSLDREIADAVSAVTERDLFKFDPYLFAHLQQGTIRALQALHQETKMDQRREFRLALEQIRQALRDLREGLPTDERRSVRQMLKWLTGEIAKIGRASCRERV